MKLPKNKKVYFASDNHLGLNAELSSNEREKFFVAWLDTVRKDAAAIYLLGDLFDFWFEYQKVVPKGFVRVLGKLAELTDSGIPITFFVGNHDLWMKDYFKKELGISNRNYSLFIRGGLYESMKDTRYSFYFEDDNLNPGEAHRNDIVWNTSTGNLIWVDDRGDYTIQAYDSVTGILSVTAAAAHGLSNGNNIQIVEESLVFKCSQDNYTDEKKYPRASDPAGGNALLPITVVNTTKFTVNVGVQTGGGTVSSAQMELIMSILETSTV